MNHPFRSAAIAAVLALAGCNLPQPQPDTVRHFTLAGPVTAAPVANATIVRPVQVAGHLRPRSLAVRVAENEVAYIDDFRWAEPLDGAIGEILRNRLDTVGTGAVVSVQVDRFEPIRFEGNKVELAATFTIADRATDRVPRQSVFVSTPRTWDGHDYGALAGQMRAAVDELADAIAAAIDGKK